MRLGGLLFSAVTVVGLLVATQACSLFGGDTSTKEDRLCTPGDVVFCRCADKAEGTKVCKDDGQAFEACMNNTTTGECAGGEIPDPRTNEPLPDEDGGPKLPPDKPNAIETCPGKSTALTAGVDIKLEGDTTTAVNDRKGKQGACAVGAGANDHIYRLIASGSGSLEVKVQGTGGLDPVVYLRTSCDDETTQASCLPPTPTKLVQTKINVTVGKEYFLIIDGASGSAGKYEANLKLTTGSFCGDGKVDANEACDDGNKTEDDGCSNDCKKVNGNPTTAGGCPGQPVDVWPGQTVTGTNSTTPYGNAWNAPSSSACSVDTTGTNSYQDHIYEVTPHATGSLVINVTAPPTGTLPNLMIAARKTCNAIGPEVAYCVNDATIGNPETLTIPVTNGQKIYIAVDGGSTTSNKGDYSISFKVQ